jgi:hypothetical protein
MTALTLRRTETPSGTYTATYRLKEALDRTEARARKRRGAKS